MWIKIAVQETNPVLLVAIRLSLAIVTLFIVALITRQKCPESRSLWVVLLLFGFTNTAIPYLLITWGEQYIDSGVAAILNSTTPLFAMVIAHLALDDDRMTLNKVVGLLIGFAGIILIVSRDINGTEFIKGSNLLVFLGQGAVLLASILYAGSSVFAKRRLKGLSPTVQGLVPLLASTVVLWLFVPIVDNPVNFPQSDLVWFSLLWLGILGTGIAFLLYFFLIHSVGPTRATLVTYVFPIVGVLLGVVFLNELLDWKLVMGTVLVVGSIVIVNSSG